VEAKTKDTSTEDFAWEVIKKMERPEEMAFNMTAKGRILRNKYAEKWSYSLLI